MALLALGRTESGEGARGRPVRHLSAPVTRDGESLAQLSVIVGTGGRHIVANIVGSPAGTGPCTASYTLSISESKQAVAIAVVPHPHGGSQNGGLVACSAVGYPRHVSAELSAPLGTRVVVDAKTGGAAASSPVNVGSVGSSPCDDHIGMIGAICRARQPFVDHILIEPNFDGASVRSDGHSPPHQVVALAS